VYVTFRLVCERFGSFARGSNVFCERFVLHVCAFIVLTSIGLNCVCVHNLVPFGRPYILPLKGLTKLYDRIYLEITVYYIFISYRQCA
jgi:hypothetical protein